MKDEKGTVIYIGERDIFEWTQGVGRDILMPKIFEASNDLIENELDSKLAVRVKFLEGNRKLTYDFVVQRKGLDNTLEKVMEWALEEEEYEMCSEIKRLQDKLYAF